MATAEHTSATIIPKYTVQREPHGRTWGVYRNGELIEGGFFEKANAEDCMATWAGFISGRPYP